MVVSIEKKVKIISQRDNGRKKNEQQFVEMAFVMPTNLYATNSDACDFSPLSLDFHWNALSFSISLFQLYFRMVFSVVPFSTEFSSYTSALIN